MGQFSSSFHFYTNDVLVDNNRAITTLFQDEANFSLLNYFQFSLESKLNQDERVITIPPNFLFFLK